MYYFFVFSRRFTVSITIKNGCMGAIFTFSYSITNKNYRFLHFLTCIMNNGVL